MNSHTAVIFEIQKQLLAKSALLSRLSAKHRRLTNELSHAKLHNAAGATALDDLKLVAGNCERPNRCAWMTSQCKESLTMSSTAAFSALLAERKNDKNCYEALTTESSLLLSWPPR